MKDKSDQIKQMALNRLVILGDMMGDGLHREPDGKWISKEYKRALKEAGIIPKRRINTEKIDEFMKKRVTENKCSCGGSLTQTRKGSFRAKCNECGKVWQLGRRK
ncbi:MAG: hypothetical protein ACC608_09505 [Anaerofustis sp.]